MQDLIDWKKSEGRMPLMVYGARQVGKSTTIYEFGKTHYSNVALFNFEHNKPLQSIFEKDLDPKRIIPELEALAGETISKGTTLVFFDEIQECPKAITSLKYFCEKAPEYHVIAAGSLLGVTISRKKDGEGTSFPVGKVNLLTVYPMTFLEFLMEINPMMIDRIKECFTADEAMPEALHSKALELYRIYLFTGGMPKAVSEYSQGKDHDFVRFAQNEILSMYHSDMGKYSTRSELIKIEEVYGSIPAQLAKENKKFQYSMIKSGARASTYETGLHWLTSAGLVIKCHKVREGKYPLAPFVDMTAYKIYMNDVGLLNAKSSVARNRILSDSISGEVKGSMTENYVAQELAAKGSTLYYWESDGRAEVDFVLQLGDRTVPIEVKSADNTQSKSLKVYASRYGPEYSIRISAKNFGFENKIKSVPLYAVWCIE